MIQRARRLFSARLRLAAAVLAASYAIVFHGMYETSISPIGLRSGCTEG